MTIQPVTKEAEKHMKKVRAEKGYDRFETQDNYMPKPLSFLFWLLAVLVPFAVIIIGHMLWNR